MFVPLETRQLSLLMKPSEVYLRKALASMLRSPLVVYARL